ncbi:hypothetical protein N836_16150 [Leptolyngbya sp. Heron Island J]|uniref:hypothetical protein n=1 Tax=Leptolyngbya sp. Heron Island J TaxID=1385935 RepID=UPI0003B9C412|nr:hypothetical protein [Leptolyngbya sp. Heron Island J]ESA34637.1 hypothetical protein N836_16150 [Leptolyngbya sp. Heron Island J]
MTSPQPNIKINIGGDNSGQLAIGDNNSQEYTNLVNSQNTAPAPADLATLRQMSATLKTQVAEAAPADKKASALERIDELEAAITAEEPDLTTMDYIKRWFVKNLPTLSGAVTSVVIHPIVGKLVEAAGTMAADEFQERFS